MGTTYLDVRQSIYRGILQELFPYATSTTLDVLLASINADLTPPLKVDATSTPSLVVNVGSTIVANPESNRNKSISFINNVIPSLLSGTVTFPSANGGTISTSTGQTYVLTLPSGDYAQALLSVDSSGNILVTMGTPNAVLASAAVPSPVSNSLPFAYLTLQNIGGTVQNIVQNQIYQFVGGGGSGSGGGGGAANEVALSASTTSVNVTLALAQSGTNYVVLAQIINLVDANPEYIPITITNRTTTGFTASWNAPLPSGNYFLDYMIPPGITQEQAGESLVGISTTSVTITMPIALSSTSYVVVATLVDLSDTNPQFQPVTITSKTISTFTAAWNMPTDSTNYRLDWTIAAYS